MLGLGFGLGTTIRKRQVAADMVEGGRERGVPEGGEFPKKHTSFPSELTL